MTSSSDYYLLQIIQNEIWQFHVQRDSTELKVKQLQISTLYTTPNERTIYKWWWLPEIQTWSTTNLTCLFIAYSKANAEKFPWRQSFSSALTKAFAETGPEVSHRACCQEYHKNNDIHYHMAVNLAKLRHSKSVKEQLKSKHNINVHFSDKYLGYIAAYRCIFKSEKDVLHTENHPDLEILAPSEPKLHDSQYGKKQCHSEVWWT